MFSTIRDIRDGLLASSFRLMLSFSCFPWICSYIFSGNEFDESTCVCIASSVSWVHNMQSISLDKNPSACIQSGHLKSMGITFPSDGAVGERWESLIRFLRRCHVGSLLLHASAACPNFGLRTVHVPAAMHLWRDDAGGFRAEWSTMQRQRLQLLRFSRMHDTVAVRLSFSDQRLRHVPGFAAWIIRRCLSMRGGNALLRLPLADDDFVQEVMEEPF